MLSSEEILKKLYAMSSQFLTDVYTKKYTKAVYEYEAARNIALFMELSEEQIIELFGTRQTDEPIRGLYDEELAIKAQWECVIRNQTLQEITMEDKRRREEEWKRSLES